jgi:hypothetical protein
MEDLIMRTSTLVLNFDNGYSDSEIENVFKEFNVWGTKVSSLIKRYAVEIPAGKEEEFMDKFEERDEVSYIFEDCLRPKKPKFRR